MRKLILAAALFAATMVSAASAEVRDHRTAPVFTVQAISVYANDETGPDWPGSDNIRVRFFNYQDRTDTFTDSLSQTFRGFDTGELFYFTHGNGANCVQPFNRRCVNGRPAVTRPSFRIRVEELSGNDLLGEAFVDYHPRVLLERMPNRRDTWEDSRRIGGYTVYFYFKRWA